MTFKELLENGDDLKPEVVKNRLRYAIEQFMEIYNWLDDEEVVNALMTGNFNYIEELEGNDMFGTEGLDVTKGDDNV